MCGCASRRQQFVNQHPTGYLNKADFFRHYGSTLKQEVSDHLFDLIDTNKDETIDIDEWVVAKKITEAGNLEDKLKCALLTCQHLQYWFLTSKPRSLLSFL
jgi:Ca2+-binding EF-hand superfamily protein